MNETMPISAGLPAGMTTDACLEAHLRSAFLTGETDGEEAGLRPEFVINDPDRRIKVLTVIEDELARCTSFDISVAFVTMSGIEPLLPIFEELRERGVPGRVLTTDYLCFSDPAAMRKLAGISNIEARLSHEGLHLQFGRHLPLPDRKLEPDGHGARDEPRVERKARLEADGCLCKGASGRIQGALGPSAQPSPP